MKGAKRDVEREIKVPVYSATYSGKGISYKTTARSAEQRRNDAALYDRELRRKLDRRAAQRAVEAQNRKVKMERKRKAGAKRAKEAFERLWQQGTSAQAMRVLDDQRAEREARRRKQIKSGRKFVVALGDSMSGAALNAGFQFARSKIPNDKSWRNAYDQVQADWATRKQLTRKWTRILERRMRHRKVQAGKEGCKGKRVFMCSKRAMAVDGVCGKGAASFWKPVIVCCLLAYVSSVTGIGVGTGMFVLYTKRFPGADSYDPPGRFCRWGWEPIECRGHPFGFDWKERRAEFSKLRNATDTEETAKPERPPRFRKLLSIASQHVHKSVESDAADSSESQRSAEARSFGMLRQPWEYLWSPTKKQLASERAGKGWKLQQIQPAEIQDYAASSEVQVVEASPGVSVAYPVEWLTAKVKPDYVRVTLRSGLVVRYCRDKMEEEVLDTSAGGCHVRMQPVCASIGIRHGQVILGGHDSEVGAAQMLDIDDDLPSLIASDSDEDDEDDGGSESTEGHSDDSSGLQTIGSAQPLRDWHVMSEAFRRWTRYDGNETSDEESSVTDDWDENSAAGSVQGLNGAFAAWRARNTIATIFAGWRWCVKIQSLAESDTDGNLDGGQDSDSDDDDGPGDDDFPETVDAIEQPSVLPLGPNNPAGVLWKGQLNDFSAPRGGYGEVQRNQPLNMSDIKTQVRRFEACELYCAHRHWAMRDTDLVELRLIVDLGIDLEYMRDSSMQRLLMRWRLFANRLHNGRIRAYTWHRQNEFDMLGCCFQSWIYWAKAPRLSRRLPKCRARDANVPVDGGNRLADVLTTALTQDNHGGSRSRMRQLPVLHPLSAVMRLEPYRFFEFDADSQQYTSAFMGVQSEATAYLTTIHAQVAQGTRLHLVDSGSSVYTSPHKDTLVLPIKTNLKLTGVGGAQSDFMSPLIYTVLDVHGKYVVLHYQAVYYLPSVPVALFATGPFEQQGWTFHLNAQAPCMTKGGGTCVPLFKDRVTGFTWIVERTHAGPTIIGRRELVKQLATHPNMAGVDMAYTPILDSSEQRTLLSEVEPKPTKLLSQYEYDTYIDRIRLGGEKALVNTREKANKQAESDKIGHDALQNLWKMTIADFDKRKAKMNDAKTEQETEEPEEPEEQFLQREDDAEVKEEAESGGTEPGGVKVKMETDDAFFKRQRKEKQSTPQSRPIRLKIPRSRFYDSCQPKDVQKQHGR